MVLTGCGHQVTGLNTPGGGNIVAPGETLLRFETAALPNFNTTRYLIVINATGDGQVPTAQGSNSNYREWSFAFFVGGGPGFVNTPDVEQYYTDPSAAGGVKYTLAHAFTPNTPRAKHSVPTRRKAAITNPAAPPGKFLTLSPGLGLENFQMKKASRN